ncbi:MAG: HD domain-containing protein [Candidatus Jorgensenbacteria bacterium]
MVPARDAAWQLLSEYLTAESLRRHCLAVEAAMRAYARHYGEDENEWGICGLLHDFDYERFPTREGHPAEGVKVLRARGYPEEILNAILGHADYLGVPRESRMAKCLFAVDELCGFLMALAHVRPQHFEGMAPDSVERNLKKKGFAVNIHREEIDRGVAELEVDRAEHFTRVIAALNEIALQLGF